ncbi:hypothetical protein RIR_jg4079.t1 [Rhizophagus irregularis DAOM 181602=DAOM 197198]|nr:hypothetical protein RIR_jg4079.t1 [Rhizophagus irregularis DAOM 181602=DAOM 197198]
MQHTIPLVLREGNSIRDASRYPDLIFQNIIVIPQLSNARSQQSKLGCNTLYKMGIIQCYVTNINDFRSDLI